MVNNKMVKKSQKYMKSEEAELIDKWIIILLSSDNNAPIKGRIRFTKDFFLIAEKFLHDLYNASEFYPYHFGPYSTRFGVRVNNLRKNNLIQAKLVNQDWEYSLTEKGIKLVNFLIEDIPEDLLKNIENIKTKNKSLPLKQILKDLYIDYPNFAKRSIKKVEYSREKTNLSRFEKIKDGPGFVAPFALGEREIELKGKAAKIFLKLLSE